MSDAQQEDGILSDLNRECCFCMKTFKTMRNLTNHLCTHTGNKPYQCTTCQNQKLESNNFDIFNFKFI